MIPYLTILKVGAPILLVLSAGYCTYQKGNEAGQATVQSKWDKQKQADAALIEQVKKENAAKEAAHNNTDRKISDELANLKIENANAIANVRIAADKRVSDSAKRESMYRTAAEGSASERASLASHAAELDRLLGESVGLLQEGGLLIELRDGQLRQLAAQITNDRKLIENTDADEAVQP